MKKSNKIFLLSSLLILIWACSGKPEPNLELFSPEAFAFDVGDSWEINTSVNVKGFAVNENEPKPEIKIYYKINLITPKADTIKAIFDKNVILEQEDDEDETMELPLEAQIDLDSTFAEGKYILNFYVSDEVSKQVQTINIPVELKE